jgi:hypothetical protein
MRLIVPSTQPRALAAAPLEPTSAVQVHASPFHRPGTRGVQPSALEPAPPPSMGCPLRSRSPWPELRLRHPGPFRAPGALVRSCQSGRPVILRAVSPGPTRS